MLLLTTFAGLDPLAVKTSPLILHLASSLQSKYVKSIKETQYTACRREKCFSQILGYYAPNLTSSILQIIKSFVMDAPKKCHIIRYKRQKPDTKDWY